MSVNRKKPTFGADQLISSSNASKHFGELRKKAKDLSQFITDNGTVDTVVLDYHYYENLCVRLSELEEREAERMLIERMERLDREPAVGVAWRNARRSE